MKLVEAVRTAALSHGHADPQILALYLLGSVARGEERLALANSMAVELKRSVDIGEVSSKNLVYSYEVLLKGTQLYAQDQYQADLYRANLLGMYLQINFDRREVLDAYRA